MKRFCLLLILVISGVYVSAQTIDTLPADHDAFVDGLIKKFEATKKDNLKDLAKTFEKKVEDGTFTDVHLDNLIATTNQMLKLKGKTSPQLQIVTETYLKLIEIELESERLEDWQEVLMQVMLNSKKGDTKTTTEFLEFSIPLLEKNALFDSKAKSWYMTSDAFSLSYGDRGPVVSAPKTDIMGATPTDTINVYNSGGKYYVFETTWEASHGEVDWTKVGLPKADVYCVFDDYIIDMSKQNYVVDSVFFVYEGYFEAPVNGVLEDKLMSNNKNFPRFAASSEKVPPQQITENIIYEGGFTLAGSKVLGRNEGEESKLTIYKPNSTQKVLTATSEYVTIDRDDKITANDAEVSLYFDNDSIFHPSINLTYTIIEDMVKLVKGETSLSKSKFLDSYHNIEFEADVVTWTLSEDFIEINTISTSGIKPAFYESNEFFSDQKMKKIRGNVSYDPLSILNKYCESYDTQIIPADVYAKLISPTMTEQQAKPLLFQLVQEGFITYDEKTSIIKVKDKVNHYVRANAKFKDYDNISIKSTTDKQNGRIDMKSNDIILEGVDNVPISYATMTEFFPDSGRIIIQEDRDMLFDGMFFCGRVDVFGRENYFIYDSFDMDVPLIDTFILNIPDGDKTDAQGNPLLRPLNTVIEELDGDININIPINKSGRADLAQFPVFTSNEKSKVYFENNNIRNGTYSRDDFFYELDPFVMDSLSHINFHNIVFDGVLYSANIFPEIREPLRVQDDFTLGFFLEAPEEGFALYQGKGTFISDITLNSKGLTGDGKVQYMTADIDATEIAFYPDSLHCVASVFNMGESRGEYEAPKASSSNNKVRWVPYQDTMTIASNPEYPFEMYDKITMNGDLTVTDKRVIGSGVADWDDAGLSSNLFHFKGQEILADTASLEIKSIEGDKVTFNTPNVNAHVNFEENTGFFKSNLKDNPTEFGYNQYMTSIDEFFWDIDEKILEFSMPEGQEVGAEFTSIHPDQDSLTFTAKKVTYSLTTSIMDASDVTEILVADSRVIPGDGKLSIHPHAEMKSINNAIIEADAISKKHRIENVTATIEGKNKMTARGEYIYQPKEGEVQRIDLSEITVIVADSTMIDKKKKNQAPPEHILYGVGDVSQSEQLVVYPNVNFYGDVEFISSLDNPKINGFVRVDFQNDYVASDYINIHTEINPQSLRMNVSEAVNSNGEKVRTGIFISKMSIDPLYTNILNTNVLASDIPLIEATNMLEHRDANNEYAFGNEEKLDNQDMVMKGNILIFNPENNDVYGEGSLDLGLELMGIVDRAAGNVTTNLSEGEYKINATLALPMELDKTVLEKIGYYWFEDNFDQEDVNYENEDLQRQFAEFVSEKTLVKMQDEIATTGFFKKPKEIKESIILTDVDLVYDDVNRRYLSEGKIGISFIGDKEVHKKIEGWVEMGHRMGLNTPDFFHIYLKTGLGDWIYFNFNGTNLEIVSSYNDINSAIKAVDGGKRVVKGENGKSFIYGVSTEYKAKLFLERMKTGEASPANGGAGSTPQIIDFGTEEDDDGPQIIEIGGGTYENGGGTNGTGGFSPDSPFSKPPSQEDEEETDES
ncbi:MAG: hypothetical protein ACPG4Z_05245, partial [Chitinophagales bacterium]